MASPTCSSPTNPPVRQSPSYDRDVLDLLGALADGGQTVVMVTDPLAASCAGEALFLADGQIVGRLQHTHASAIAQRMSELEQP